MAEKNSVFLESVKTAGLAVIFSLVSILIFAGVVYISNINTATIKIVNQFIKVITIAIAGLIKINGSKGILKGALAGFFYAVLIHLIFMLIGEGSFNGSFWLDLLFTSVIGGIVGIIAVNVKDK